MIKDFEVFKTKKDDYWENRTFKFKLNDKTFYSEYAISESQGRIYASHYYYFDPELNLNTFHFSEESRNEINDIILKQKDIRLRHLFKPYDIK